MTGALSARRSSEIRVGVCLRLRGPDEACALGAAERENQSVTMIVPAISSWPLPQKMSQ
jgi:hypothetical protein